MPRRTVALAAAALLLTLTACSGGNDGGTASAPADPAKVSGDITVLTHKTDLAADGTLTRYAAEFNQVYPNVHVKFEPVNAYETDVKVRLNSSNYGDVLMIPAAVPVADYPKFFAPLGAPDQLKAKYQFVDKGTYEGQVYGVAINGNATGMVYNKKVWQQAGITSWPATAEEFLADLRAIKAKTSAVPVDTIYHEGWPLTVWQSFLGELSCDPNAQDGLATDNAPWAPGKELNKIDTMLYDVVKGGLVEQDPTTSSWDAAKSGIASGKVGTLVLASWAISQMKAAAKAGGTDPADIGFMPYPAQAGGHFCSLVSPDYLQAVSIHSEHKEAARAWLDWFVDKSTYAQDQELLPTLKSAPLPATMKAYQEAGVQFVEESQAKNATVTSIDKEAEVGLATPDYRQHIVDMARGAATGSLDSYFGELNKKWATGLKNAGS